MEEIDKDNMEDKNDENIEYQEEEINIKYRNFKIKVNISEDNNYIKLACSPKNNKYEIYECILNKSEFLEIFNIELTSEDCFDQIEKIFKYKNLEIKYDENLYNLSMIVIQKNKEVKFNKNIDASKVMFKNNPHLKFKETVYTSNCGGGCNSTFDVFLCHNDLKSYLATSNYLNFNIDIISLEDNQVISSLIGHKSEIYSIRYFINDINNDEFLISSDANKKVIVWNIRKDYNIEFSLIINYSRNRNIYSCIITNIQDLNYIIISSYSSYTNKSSYEINSSKEPNDCTKMYSLINGSFIKNIYNTNNNCTRYLFSWYNEQDDEKYIVECCDGKISINNLLKKENYCTFKSEIEGEEFLTGYIFSKKNVDYLCTGSWNGYVRIWDLIEKCEVNSVKTMYLELYNIIPWTNKYAIIGNKFNKCLMIINVDILDVGLKIKCESLNKVRCLKKIIHPIYGESLLCGGEDNNINLFVLYNKF